MPACNATLTLHRNQKGHRMIDRLVVCSIALLMCLSARADDRPDVLFIAVDDLNTWIGAMDGHPQTKTPNIDALAARGMLFTNAHSPGPACLPARTAILTGVSPFNSGQ